MAAFRMLGCVLRCRISVPEVGSSSQFNRFARVYEPCYRSATHSVVIQQTRMMSFFGNLTADELWKGVLAESNISAQRSRGKRTKKRIKKNLNIGQAIGDGKSGYLWPGLNAPLLSSGTKQAIGKRDEEQLEAQQAKIMQDRDYYEKQRKTRVKRARGWTGNSWGGISVGHPDPGPNGETYEDFECRVIELKRVSTMTAREGRSKQLSVLVVAGNGNGAAGFALGKSKDRLTAIRKAKNKAIQNILYIERYNDHTVFHDMSTTYKKTTIKVKKQNYGYGLHCHRAIITICKLLGIKDLYAKVRGSVNLLNLTRAFFLGLMQQETHQDLANKKSLHVVEFREELGPYPLIVASPQGTLSTIPEPVGEIPNTKLDWDDVKVTQGLKRSIWADVKRNVW
ncbi:small ribosomal subunit protein uS5m isoform X2 [Eleutherodactylus coqui]|uniref:small ribosomal subunit protein uS5m isoform X2 n=1 Tax=Eleutherodactylus coqui TaxID=57060 RepID=UPI003461D639